MNGEPPNSPAPVTRMGDHCNCRVCTDHRRWLAALNPQTDEAKAAFNEMCTNLEAYSTDAVYYRMKLEGTWGKP